jgi:hypothetical protein
MKRFLLACLLFAATVPAFADNTAVSVVPTGRDWVSKGVARTFTSANAGITVTASQRHSISVAIRGNDGKAWDIELQAPVGETLEPGQYFFAERWGFQKGRAPALDYAGDGAGCNRVLGAFSIRQIQFNAAGQLLRLEANATHYCENYGSPPVGIGIVYQAPPMNFWIDAADLQRVGRGYYGDTSTYSLVSASLTAFQYKAAGLRDKWTMNFAVPTGQAYFVKGVYLTEGTAVPNRAGMDLRLGTTRKAEPGKLEILTIGYRNGEVVQLSARYWFYTDLSRTTIVRSGRINYWK